MSVVGIGANASGPGSGFSLLREVRSGARPGDAEESAPGGRHRSERSVRGRERSTADDDEQNPQKLSKDDQRVVDKMKARDREVRAHEMAHVSAGGAHVTSGPTYSFQTGPDGKRYAVGGEVGIDTSPEKDPRATIAKMAQVRAAALAPAEPSGADRAVAAAAAQESAKARAEMTQSQTDEATGSADEDGGSDAVAAAVPVTDSSTGPEIHERAAARYAEWTAPAVGLIDLQA